MKAHWWSCVLGLLYMPAGVILSPWTVSQEPTSISLMRVNSSAEITCSTSLSDPMGLYLRRGVQSNMDIIYLSLVEGKINRRTIASEFTDRVHIAYGKIEEGKRFTVQLSLLALDDTNWYYCTWETFKSETAEQQTLSSNGTIIIVTERGPQEQCQTPIWDLVLIASSVIAFTVILSLVIGALVLRCRFKKQFRPARVTSPPRPPRPPRVCPQCPEHHPYLVTSINTLDFRGIL
ncbi:uncharacterized protein LOC118326941 [Morone saxatilis]|uniref:uncharacterized protein LOC118326941 n=1 Tax=Morone saxatilis TaxID=34816 RepID=UPI0015E1CBE7|nr:uncharacterized protein LOC118326941 [Morone saxatilis]